MAMTYEEWVRKQNASAPLQNQELVTQEAPAQPAKQPETQTVPEVQTVPENQFGYTNDYRNPFGMDYLDRKYQSTVTTLYRANEKNKVKQSSETMLNDAFSAVDTWMQYVRESGSLRGNDVSDKNIGIYGKAADKAYDDFLQTKLWDYQTAGMDYQTMYGERKKSGYQTRAEREQAEKERYTARYGNEWSQWAGNHTREEMEGARQFYENLPAYMQLAGSMGADKLPGNMRAAYEDFQQKTAGQTGVNWQEYGKQQLQAIQQAQATPAPTYDAEEKAAADWAKNNLDLREDAIKTYRNMADEVVSDNRTLNDGQWQKLWQDVPDDVTAAAMRLREYGEGDGSDRQIINEYFNRRADLLEGTKDIYQNRENTAYENYLNQKMRSTTEGAREWLEDARGTDEEQQARDNLYFVENREKYAKMRENPDYSAMSRNTTETVNQRDPDSILDGVINNIGDTREDVLQASDQNANVGRYAVYTYMTDDEVADYNYIKNTEGMEAAKKYLEYKEYELNRRASEAAQENMRKLGQSGWGGAVAASALSVPMGLSRGFGYLDAVMQGLSGNRPVDRYRGFNAAGAMADAAREGVMDSVDWQVNVLGQDRDLFDFLYGTTMSGVDSLAAGALGGPVVGALLLGGGAAQSTMQDIYDREGSDKQALIGGLVSGVFESLFEKVSLGEFFKEAKSLGKEGFKKALKEVGKETLVNFSEEFNTEVANILYDKLANGKQSDYQKEIDFLTARGFTEKEAEAKVLWNKFQQALEAGAGGAVMGTAFGAIAVGRRNSNTNRANTYAGENIIKNDTANALKEIAMTLPEGSDARKEAEKFNPKNFKARQAGALYRGIYEALYASPEMQSTVKQRMTQDTAEQLVALGMMDGDAATAAEGIIGLTSGEELTEEQKQAIAANPQAFGMMRDILVGDQEETQKEGTKKPAFRETAVQGEEQAQPEQDQRRPVIPQPEQAQFSQAAVQSEEQKDQEERRPVIPQPAQAQFSQAAVQSEEQAQQDQDQRRPVIPQPAQAQFSQAAVQSEEQAQQDQEERRPIIPQPEQAQFSQAAVQGEEQAPPRQDQAQPQQGQAQRQKPAFTTVTVQGESQAQAVTRVKTDGDGLVTVELQDGRTVDLDDVETDDSRKVMMRRASRMDNDAATDMMNRYQEGQNPDDYSRGYQRVYNGAKNGKGLDEIHSIFKDVGLTPEQAQAAWEAGVRARQTQQAQAKQRNADLAKQNGFQALEENSETRQRGVVFANVTQELTETQAGQLKIIDEWLRRRGSEIQVQVHDSINDKNGRSIANGKYDTGSNTIHLSLDADNDALTRTASHEIYHYIQSWNGDAARQLQKDVLDLLRSTEGYDLDKRIKQVQDRYRKGGKTLTKQQALDEITADSMLDVLGNEENMKALMKTAEPGTIAKIREWLQNAVKELRAIMQRVAKGSPEAKALLPQVEAMQRIQQQFEAAEQAASENYRQAQQGATESARQDSFVQEYMQDMQGGEDAQTALNGLVSQLFFQTQQEWIQQNMDADMDEAMQRFADALKRYRTEQKALSTVLEAAGFAAPGNGDMNTALSYAADQLVALEERTGEEAGVQYLIKRGLTKGGREVSYVQADRQVIHGTDPNAWGGQIKQYINEQIRKGKDVIVYSPNGVPLTLTETTAGKGAFWNKDRSGNQVPVSEHALKMRMEAHIDELAQVSMGKGERKTDHKDHPIARNGFNYRTAYFQDFDGKYYSCTISVGSTGKVNTVYNVNQIKKEAGAPDELEGSLSLKRRPVSLASSEDSIAEYARDVKEQFSIKRQARDVEYMQAAVSGDVETAQRLVDEAAEEAGYVPVKRYHQTDTKFTEFNTDNPVAGANDSETPNGIFFKDNNHDIGVGGDYVKTGHGGDIQMEGYLKKGNMLHFANRQEAAEWYKRNVPGYKEAAEAWDKVYKDKWEPRFNALEEEQFDAATTDERYEELDKIEEQYIKEMGSEEKTYRKKMRELLNDYFLHGESGYDGIELDYDGHRYIDGKRENVHTYIVFKSSDVKSSDAVTYDDQGNVIPLEERFNEESNDIRYSMKDTGDADLDMKDEDVTAGVEDDAEFFAQVGEDQDARDALGLLHKLDESTNELTRGQWENRLGETADKLIGTAESKYGRVKLMQELRTLYEAMDDNRIDVGEKAMYAREIAKHLIENAVTQGDMDETMQEVRRVLKNTPFYLTDDMRSELNNARDGVGAYTRKNFGTMRIRKEGTKGAMSLSDLWVELNGIAPGTFTLDATEADMPIILDAYLENGKKVASSFFGGSEAGFATDLAYQMMLDYYDVPGALKKSQDIRKEFRQKLENFRQNFLQKQEEKLKTSRERAEATKRKQTLRNQIGQAVRYMNTRIVGQTDVRHVPEGLRGAAEAMVQPFLEKTGVFKGADLERLRREYALLAENGQNHGIDAARAYDADIEEKIDTLTRTLEGRRLAELTENELQDVKDIVGNLKKMITEANEMQVQGRKTTLETEGEAFIQEMQRRTRIKNEALKKIEDYTYKNMTPVYYADKVGGVVKDMIADLREGQNQWAFNFKNAKARFNEIAKKYKLNDWINDKDTLKFDTQRGEHIELDRDLAMSLYATWKRETTNTRQNANHLRIGGFMYQQTKENRQLEGVDTYAPHALTAADMQKIMDYLGKEQMQFVDEMVDYLSHDMAKLGNEMSMKLYGYEKFGEKYYYPYSSDRNFLTTELTDTSETNTGSIKNSGMTKATVRNASNPIVVDGFLKTWANHVNQMCLYNAFAETTDNLNRLYNYRTAGVTMLDSATGNEDVIAPRSLKLEMEKALGKEAVKYLQTLVKDVNGGVRNEDRTGIGKMLSLFKKGSVAANASVVVQQPSSIMRAMNMVNPKYFLKFTPAQIKRSMREMEQYSGVAIIKDMGRFDTGTGLGATEWLLDKVKDPSKLKRLYEKMDDWTGKGAELADKVTWGVLWQACKNEVASKMPGIEADTEEYMRAVAQRFNDVCDHTQVYDSVLSKSDAMRSTAMFDKITTSFMAEPTVSFNMLLQGLQNINTPGGKAKATRAMASFAAACALNAMLKSLVTAGRRKDDDDRTYFEKYLGEVVENFGDDMSVEGIISLVPIARDAVSIFQGYGVTRSDMEVVQTFKDAYDAVISEKKKFTEKLDMVAKAVTFATGIPYKNIARDVEGLINIFRSAPLAETSGRDIKYTVLDSLTGSPWSMFWDDKNAAYYGRIAEDMINGTGESAREQRAYLTETNGVNAQSVKDGINAELKERLQKGEDEGKIIKALTEYMGLAEDDAYFKVKEWTGGKDYKKYNSLVDAIQSGKGIRDAVSELVDHGVKKETVNSNITSNMKPIYLKLYSTDKTAAADLRANILNAYEALGYDREKKNKDIEKWLEEK